MPELSKLQIRAKVLSVISEIKMLKYRNEDALLKICSKLEDIENRHAMFDIFLKEYIKLKEEDCNFCAFVLKNAVPNDYITEKSIELLKSAALTDENKYKIVQLLRIAGENYDYNEISGYFDNPGGMTDMETKRLLSTAVYNPESMLDFLDFVSAVSENDKSLLLESLAADYQGDELANIVYPVIYSDFGRDFILQAIDILSESKSSLAIKPFEYLIEQNEDEEIVNACRKGLKMLKLAGASKEKAEEYFKNISKNLTNTHNFVTIPDGSGQQALLVSRRHPDGKISLIAAVISDLSGITDCFGFFNLTDEEVIRVINKFYNSEGQYQVPEKYVKSRLNEAEALNLKYKISFPYEYIAWRPLLSDIEPMDITLEEYAGKNCKKQLISKNYAAELLRQEYTIRWFLTPDDNKIIKTLTEEIYDNEDYDIKYINQLLKLSVNRVFDDETLKLWKNKFYNLIYVLRQNKGEKTADDFYTIMKDEELFELFKQIILQRSVFNYFTAKLENVKTSFFEKNIFKKRNAKEKHGDKTKLNLILETLKKGWFGE